MGKSYTYHILGETARDEQGSARIYPCMNKREMAQSVIKADREGRPIVAWTAQTAGGARWIDMPGPWIPAKVDSVKLPKLVDCPVCGGRERRTADGIRRHCPVCDNSGKTTRGYEKGWSPWQLEQMKAE